jgi:hypothetical protein
VVELQIQVTVTPTVVLLDDIEASVTLPETQAQAGAVLDDAVHSLGLRAAQPLAQKVVKVVPADGLPRACRRCPRVSCGCAPRPGRGRPQGTHGTCFARMQ